MNTKGKVRAPATLITESNSVGLLHRWTANSRICGYAVQEVH